MDPFDEFEFKPLTEGLGFQKKANPTTEDLKPSKSMVFDDVITSLETGHFKPALPNKTFLEVTEPLPRARESQHAIGTEIPMPTPPSRSPFPSQDIFRKPPTIKPTSAPQPPAANRVSPRRGASDSPEDSLMKASASIASAFLDLVVLTAISLIFLAALLSITKVDLNVVLRGIANEKWWDPLESTCRHASLSIL